jgi:transcriptional regulator
VQLLSTKTQQVEWRRDRVLELSSQGFNQSDIARVLQINKSIISRDMAHLKQHAKERLKTHIEDTMPVEYQKGIAAIDQVLRMCWGIVGRTDDERVRLLALALIDQCNSHKMDMVTNGAILKDALSYVNGKAEKLLSGLVRKQSGDEDEEEEEWEEEEDECL